MDVTDMKNGRTAQVGPREQSPTGFDWYEDLGV